MPLNICVIHISAGPNSLLFKTKNGRFLTIVILVNFKSSIDFSQVLWCEPDAVPHSGMSQYLCGATMDKISTNTTVGQETHKHNIPHEAAAVHPG